MCRIVNMSSVQFILLFSLLSVAFAASIPTENIESTAACDPADEGCHLHPTDCSGCCPCNETSTDLEEKKKPMEFLFLRSVTAYDSSEDNDMVLEDSIATRLQNKVDRVFRGIIVSAILFIVCASICVLSVCAFCCHIRHSDGKLKKEVNALAEKLKIDVNKKDGAPLVRKQRDPKAESCNVVVSDADIMCV